MARINVLRDVELDAPSLVEGLPGVGLVGKIAADHLVETFEMAHVGNVHCEGLPKVAVYDEGERGLTPPVRLYADEGHDLLVLQCDVPITPNAASQFAPCLAEWYERHDVTPLYLSGLPHEKDEAVPELYGVGVGAGVDMLADADVGTPPEVGLVSGPTGALMSYAVEQDADAVGLIVQSDPRFPDPEAARVLIKGGIEPLTDVDVGVEDLVERAEEIRQAKKRLAKRMQEAEEESSQARPLSMYQ